MACRGAAKRGIEPRSAARLAPPRRRPERKAKGGYARSLTSRGHARQIWPPPLRSTRLGAMNGSAYRPAAGLAERWGSGFRPSTKSGCVRPPRADAFCVRGAATPGFGAGRDCRTPLRLRASALRRTARPRQCLGSSGRGLAGQGACFDLKWRSQETTAAPFPPLSCSMYERLTKSFICNLPNGLTIVARVRQWALSSPAPP